MRTLFVSIEREGILIPVGRLVGDYASGARFTYDVQYLSDPSAKAISISLPLQEEPFSEMQTKAFFEGLLPEGFTRRSVAQWMHIDEEDYLSILHGLGRECLGALCITEEDEIADASYEKISKSQVRALAAEGTTKSVELVTKSHLSLTGASGKVGLYYSKKNDAWYLPWGTAPSTHIVKQSHVRLDSIVTNEQLSLMTAKRCGISIPETFIINVGSGKEDEVLLATQRYDRIFTDSSGKINSLPRPLRLHQEDFAQALGISSDKKYEQTEENYMKQMFDILRKFSSDPITDQLKLWDVIIFNTLIGNTDAHIKNFSLLYGSNLNGVRLAPAYDIVSTVVYEQCTREMAFAIGGERSLDAISQSVFRRAAQQVGIGERIAIEHFESMKNKFVPALDESAAILSENGYANAEQLKTRILRSRGKQLR